MATTNPIRRGKRYKRLINGVSAIAVVVFLAGMYLDQVLPALIIYAVLASAAIGADVYLRFASDVPMSDERELQLRRRASHATYWVYGYFGFFAIVGLYFLDVTGVREIGPVTEGIMYGWGALVLSWGAIYLVLKHRP